MPDLEKRSTEPEIMDDLKCSGQVVVQTLKELEFINKWLGGNFVTLNGLDKLLSVVEEPLQQGITIVDIGCGGGDMLKLLSKKVSHAGTIARLIGIDANEHIIAYAAEHTKSYPSISFQAVDVLTPDFTNQQFDVIISTLFFHHFTTAQLIELFKSLKVQARIGIVVNDLHRHWFAYYSIKWLTQLFSKSAMVKYDAPLSVRRGFSRQELEYVLKQAGITEFSLTWRWAFRWQLVIHRQNKSH